jgi:two-component system, OmpR family, phosphate regulon sensor histidine kinase PhoR
MNRLSAKGSTPLASRFLVYYAIAYVVLIGAMGWFILLSAESSFTTTLVDRLQTDVFLARAGMPEDTGEFQAWVDQMSELSGYRFTVIDPEGVVLADSHQDPAVMENHSDRPEVQAAQAGGVGRATRLSVSTGFEQHYVAVPASDGNVLRLSWSSEALAETLRPLRRSVLLISTLVGLIGILIVGLLARRMAAPISDLTDQTLSLAGGTELTGLRRSSVRELDQLGSAIEELNKESRDRLAEARDATATLQAVLGALPQATLLIGANDQVVYSNPSASQLLGVVPTTLSGLAPFPLQSAVRESRLERETVVRLVDHGKPVRRLRGVASALDDDDRILLVVDDVTEQARAASVRRDFVANASHELKTPVSAIIAAADTLQMAVERGDASAVQFAKRIEGSARQLDSLVTDLLDLSRLERDQPEMEPQRFDVLVKEEVERARSSDHEQGIDWSIDVTPVRVAGSGHDIAIAVRNLLHNSVRYTAAGGSITVRLGREADEAVLRISDTGEGIPTRDLDRIFERFYRVDSARARATGGTGLGLAIVKHVVESHLGTVEVESELGVGSTFTVRLPLLIEDSEDGALA